MVAGKMMGLYDTFLLLTTSYVYSAYRASQPSEAGSIMVSAMRVMDLIFVPVLCYRHFSKRTPTSLTA